MMVAEVLRRPARARPSRSRRHHRDRLQRLHRRQSRNLRRRDGDDAGRRKGDRGTEEARRDHAGDQRRCRRVEGWQAWSRPAPMPAGSSRSICPPSPRARSACTGGPISAEVQLNAQGQGPGFTTHICDVEVDPETGHVKILRYTAIQDVGRAIHPPTSRARCKAVSRKASVGPSARNTSTIRARSFGGTQASSITACRSAPDMPMIDTIMIEVPNPRHPFGAQRRRRGPDRCRPWPRSRQRDRRCDRARLRDLPMSLPKLRAAFDAAEQPARGGGITTLVRRGLDASLGGRRVPRICPHYRRYKNPAVVKLKDNTKTLPAFENERDW